MDELNLENGEWSPVTVGPDLLGWAGPSSYSRTPKADITVQMGDGRFSINVSDFSLTMLSILAVENLLDVGEADLVRMAVGYGRQFLVLFPDGSLDISNEDEIEYSSRSVEALCTGLAKFFKAMAVTVQSELNAKATPVEVVRKCAELVAYSYPKVLMNQMSWRGIGLNGLLADSRMRVKAVKYEGRNYTKSGISFRSTRYGGFGPTGSLKGSTPFSSFVEWQTRMDYGNSLRAPENVFLVRAFSLEEEELGLRILLRLNLLERFSIAARRAMMPDASFFLCRAGDPMEEWVDGESLSVKELAELIQEG